MRFDFLRDGLPDAIEGALAFRLPRRLRTAAVAMVALICVLAACAAFERARTNAATAIESRERSRLDVAKDRLAAANLELNEVAALLETDRRLRALRASGTLATIRLARIGNVVPRGVWLSSVQPSSAGLDVEGEAVNLAAVDRVLSNLLDGDRSDRTQLLRMTRVARAHGPALVSFTLQLKDSR
jgi:Tfp pilus assembly protein PilN